MPDRTITGLDIDLLKVMAHLLETRSVTKTAVRLNLTQSAVSKALKRLRETFDDPLFVRQTHGLLPTPRALALEPQLHTALAAIDHLISGETFNPAQARITFTIAASDFGIAVVLTPLLARLARAAPNIRIAIEPLFRRDLLDSLTSGAADLALGGLDRAPDSVKSRLLFRDPFVVGGRADHPLLKRKLDLDRFCAANHAIVSFGGGPPFSGRTDDALATLGRQRRVMLAVPNFLALPTILRGSDLIAVAPARLFALFPDGLKVQKPPLDVPPLPLSMLWHTRTQASQAHVWLREQIVGAVSVR